jgi:hypothetical protein
MTEPNAASGPEKLDTQNLNTEVPNAEKSKPEELSQELDAEEAEKPDAAKSNTEESAITHRVPEKTSLSPREFRVSEQERHHVAEVLHKALERGLLNPAEFTARTEKALASHTRAELNGVLAQLPGLIHRDKTVGR